MAKNAWKIGKITQNCKRIFFLSKIAKILKKHLLFIFKKQVGSTHHLLRYMNMSTEKNMFAFFCMYAIVFVPCHQAFSTAFSVKYVHVQIVHSGNVLTTYIVFGVELMHI